MRRFPARSLLKYADLGHKIVVLDRELDHPNINQVLLDNKAGAALAVEHLIEQGHRKLYVVTGPKGSYDSKQRLKAVKQTADRFDGVGWLKSKGISTKPTGNGPPSGSFGNTLLPWPSFA